jgi:hypothetical protein
MTGKKRGRLKTWDEFQSNCRASYNNEVEGIGALSCLGVLLKAWARESLLTEAVTVS